MADPIWTRTRKRGAAVTGGPIALFTVGTGRIYVAQIVGLVS